MTAKVTQADREAAADLASMSENICFGGNDAAAIRNNISIDRKIDEFVERVARHRIAAFNAGQKAMREAAAKVVNPFGKAGSAINIQCADAIRDLKIGEE